MPVSEFELSSFEDGYGFDGSSIRGWQPINASDMLVIPDTATAKIDPFYEQPTLVLIGNVWIPLPGKHTPATRAISRRKRKLFKTGRYQRHRFYRSGSGVFIFDDVGLIPAATTRFIRWIPRKGSGTRARDEFPNLTTTSRSTKRLLPGAAPG
ncbi:MAG: glutamine synthetase beta-grasp domain-containing protein [Desulfobacterales bacterium]